MENLVGSTLSEQPKPVNLGRHFSSRTNCEECANQGKLQARQSSPAATLQGIGTEDSQARGANHAIFDVILMSFGFESETSLLR